MKEITTAAEHSLEKKPDFLPPLEDEEWTEEEIRREIKTALTHKIRDSYEHHPDIG